jgi:peptidoglycan/xylan/chitin deacetylase (PgdA/CDA1 family)
MEYLRENGYDVISLDDLIKAIEKRRPLSPKSVVLTFDDGLANNYEYAFAILREYRCPAIFFISPQQIGEDGYLTWAQVNEMKASGLQFGSHGMSQAYLPDLTPEEQSREIEGSKRLLEEKLDMPVYYFAYPVGGFSEAIKEKIKSGGYRAALTTNRGTDRHNKDLYELKRIRLSDKDNKEIYLWAKFSGYYNLLRKFKKSH